MKKAKRVRFVVVQRRENLLAMHQAATFASGMLKATAQLAVAAAAAIESMRKAVARFRGSIATEEFKRALGQISLRPIQPAAGD